MFIFSSSKIRIGTLFKLASNWSWGLLVVLCFLFAFSMRNILSSSSKYKINERLKEDSFSCDSKVFLEKIGQGPLSLNSLEKKVFSPDLSQELVLLARNLKPGRGSDKVDFLLSLRSSKAERKLRNGEKVFLSCDPVGGGSLPVYRFSDTKTALWIKPVLFDQNKVFIEVGLFSPSKDSELFQEERFQFILKEDGPGKVGVQELSFIETLKKAKLWGRDVLLTRFGGDKYKALKDKVKVEIPGDGKTCFYFLGLGDALQWDGASWVPVFLSESCIEHPLAQVKSITSKAIELEVWDSEGFCSWFIKLDQQVLNRGGIKTENSPHSVRLRSSKQVSCSFGKKRCFLKEGDWILKTSRGWRKLKRAVDIENYLNHRLSGELFVFDSLQEDHEKLMMKGFWVDEMRVQAFPFEIPLVGNKKGNSSKKEGKPSVLKKNTNSFITYFPILSEQEIEGPQ